MFLGEIAMVKGIEMEKLLRKRVKGKYVTDGSKIPTLDDLAEEENTEKDALCHQVIIKKYLRHVPGKKFT